MRLCECVIVWREFRIVLVCVRADRVWDHVSVCTCGHCFGSCNCVYVWTEFLDLCMCVRATQFRKV